MSPLEMIGLVLGSSFASGLNLYATVSVLGLLHRFQVTELPPGLEILSHPLVLGIAIAMYVIEFVADKVPYVDNVWDVVHTFVRPPAAAILAYAALADIPESLRIVAALLAGGVALTSHGAKASTRAAANVSPEPFSNSILSLGEDVVAVSVTWMALAHPLITIAIVIILVGTALYLIVKFLRFVSRILRRIFSRQPELSQ